MTLPSIAIIGGGIVGSTAAYYLSRAGYCVTLFDEGTGQATKASAGIICPWFTLRRNKPWYFLVSNGAEFYRKMMADLTEDGLDTQDIFQEDGALIIRKNIASLERDLEQGALKRETAPAIQAIKTVPSNQLKEYFPLLETEYDATFVQGGARLDGAALINTLHQAIEQFGGDIVRDRAQLIRQEDAILVQTNANAPEGFDRILLATGAWLPELLNPLGYQVDIRPQKGQLYSVYNDAWRNQHYPVIMPPGKIDIIPFNNGEIVIGASHEDDQGYDLTLDTVQLQALADKAHEWVPSICEMPHYRTKVGVRAYTSDYAVLVGQIPRTKNIWAISGLGSSGLTSGPFLGYQWSQLIQTGQWAIDAKDFPIERYITPLY
ncbi:FAD-binding oxidoreductase [Aerococcaceae bacterium NML201209]|nr:FAD-binding oxidoreductase [Aerococcaceae bacterium NML201209]